MNQAQTKRKREPLSSLPIAFTIYNHKSKHRVGGGSSRETAKDSDNDSENLDYNLLPVHDLEFLVPSDVVSFVVTIANTRDGEVNGLCACGNHVVTARIFPSNSRNSC